MSTDLSQPEASTATYVATRRIPLDELTPYPGNAKRGDVETILASLRRNGQYRSLVIREITDGPLIALAGNHTMQALALHGPGTCHVQGDALEAITNGRTGVQQCALCRDGWDESARCEIVHCDDATARRINLVDNRAAELGHIDEDALTELLQASLAEDGALDGTGYDEDYLNDLLADDTAPLPAGDAPVDDFTPVWGVIVECDDEQQQTELLERLAAEGRKVRSLMM